MAEGYVITYEGYGHAMPGRDTTRAARFKVEQGDSTFYFDSSLTRSAFAGFRHFDGFDLEALLVNAGLDEPDARLARERVAERSATRRPRRHRSAWPRDFAARGP